MLARRPRATRPARRPLAVSALLLILIQLERLSTVVNRPARNRARALITTIQWPASCVAGSGVTL